VAADKAAWSRRVFGGAGAWLKSNRALAIVMLAAALGFFGRSWDGDLHGDPVHYAAIAKNILSTGDWLTMHDAPGLLYAKKPPLMFWLVAVNFRLLGANTFAAESWSCLFAAASCVLVFLAGRRLFGTTAGLLGGCMLAAMPGMVLYSMDLRLDSAVALAVTATVYAVVRAVQDDRPGWLLLAGVAGGLGVMTKMAAAVHVPAVLVLALLASRPRWLLHPWLWAAVLLAAAIAAPWHVAMVARHGEAFTRVYLGHEIGERLSVGSHVPRHFAKSVLGLLKYTLPWWPLALYALFRWRGRADAREKWGLLLGALWVAEVVVATAVPPKTYDRYLTAAFPAVAMLAGCGLAWLIPARHHGRVPRVVLTLALVQAVLLAVVPVPIHTYRCKGFVEARPILDRLEPGTLLAAYVPEARFEDPKGRLGPWGLRAKATYYLDRVVRFYTKADDVVKAPVRFVAARDRYVDDLTARGFEVMLALDGSYYLLHRWRRGGAAATP